MTGTTKIKTDSLISRIQRRKKDRQQGINNYSLYKAQQLSSNLAVTGWTPRVLDKFPGPDWYDGYSEDNHDAP